MGSDRQNQWQQFLEHFETDYEDTTVVCEFMGQEFLVHPNVFSPDASIATELMVEAMSFAKGSVVLDMGCGTGVLGIHAAWRGASKVTLADNSRLAVENSRENILKYKLASYCSVVSSDLFNAIDPCQFDVIYFNWPFNDLTPSWDESKMLEHEILATAYFDPGYHLAQRFFAEAEKFLKPEGYVQISFSKCMESANWKSLDAIFRDNGWSYKTRLHRPNVTFDADIILEVRHENSPNR